MRPRFFYCLEIAIEIDLVRLVFRRFDIAVIAKLLRTRKIYKIKLFFPIAKSTDEHIASMQVAMNDPVLLHVPSHFPQLFNILVLRAFCASHTVMQSLGVFDQRSYKHFELWKLKVGDGLQAVGATGRKKQAVFVFTLQPGRRRTLGRRGRIDIELDKDRAFFQKAFEIKNGASTIGKKDLQIGNGHPFLHQSLFQNDLRKLSDQELLKAQFLFRPYTLIGNKEVVEFLRKFYPVGLSEKRYPEGVAVVKFFGAEGELRVPPIGFFHAFYL